VDFYDDSYMDEVKEDQGTCIDSLHRGVACFDSNINGTLCLFLEITVLGEVC
jgi:hypothetical protein